MSPANPVATFRDLNKNGRMDPYAVIPTMAAVREQKADIPCDSAQPLFPFGHGLTG